MRAALVLLPALLVSACTVGPDFRAPAPPDISGYSAKGDAGPPADQRVALGKRIETDWWTAFRSPALDGMIKDALSGNQDLEAARNRVAQADEEVNAAEGALLPQVSLGSSAGYQKYGRSLFGPLNF
jgi:outer membrane protein TolC